MASGDGPQAAPQTQASTVTYAIYYNDRLDHSSVWGNHYTHSTNRSLIYPQTTKPVPRLNRIGLHRYKPAKDIIIARRLKLIAVRLRVLQIIRC